MINAFFWKRIADRWSTETDGIKIPDDFSVDIEKASKIPEQDLKFMNDISNGEIDDILADLGLDEF